jgi:hypothetical protein
LRETVLVPNTSPSLQTRLAAEAHLAEGQFLLEEQKLNIDECLVCQAETGRPDSFQKGSVEFRTKRNLNKE